MKFLETKEKKDSVFFYIFFSLIFALVCLFTFSDRGELLTQKIFDPIRNADARSEIVIVGIDDKSLQSIGSWPFNRKVFADLVNKLNENDVSEIAFDILFLEKREGDEEFLKAIENSDAYIVFASKISENKYLNSYFASTTNKTLSAFAHIYPDSDGQVRSTPHSFIFSDVCIKPLSEVTFSLFTHKEIPCELYKDTYFRYANDIKKVSLVDVLNNNVDKNIFKNKIVFVGSDSLDLEDHFISISGNKIPGVYLHASILNSLLNNKLDKKLDQKLTALIIFLLGLFIVFITNKLKTFLNQTLIFMVIVFLIVILSYFAFEKNYIVPMPSFVMAIFIFGGYSTLFNFVNEKRKNIYVQSLFSKYVHKDVLDELMRGEKEIKLGGEKRRVSILFSDIRGFTSFSEIMTPEELTALLNAYLSAMSPIILKNKGTIDKYIGDAIMAFWNAPLETKNHESLALHSALLMQKTLKDFNKENKASLAMGVGLNAGEVVVGNVGSSDRINYTILGDTVNTTSRLEGLTKKYGVEIIVTDEIKNNFHDEKVGFRKLDVIIVKGKTEALTIYEPFYKEEINLSIVNQYEKAFDFYQKNDFTQALLILKDQPNDPPSKTLSDRILLLQKNNDATFNGVWHFDEK